MLNELSDDEDQNMQAAGVKVIHLDSVSSSSSEQANKIHGDSCATIELNDDDVSSETDSVALDAESQLRKLALDERDSFPLFRNQSSVDQ